MEAEDGLRRLGAAHTKDQLVDTLWDLRDLAFDHPAAWSGFTAEVFLQGLATQLEQAPVDGGDQVSTSLMVRALAAAMDLGRSQSGVPGDGASGRLG